MTSGFQGLTLGQQVRANKVNAQMSSGYQNRTQRQISQQKEQNHYTELRKQAEDIQSNINTFEEYQTTYSNLSPELRQFFRPPQEIGQEIEQQKQAELSKANAKIEELNRQLQYEKEMMQKTSGETSREHDIEANRLQNTLNALQNNTDKIREGYSYNEVLNYAEQKAQYNQNTLNQTKISVLNKSEFEKANPTEKLLYDKQGNVIGVESGIFQKTFNLENYSKAVDKNNALYNAYVKATENMQSIDPTIKMLKEIRTGTIPLFNKDQKPLADIPKVRISERIADESAGFIGKITGSEWFGKQAGMPIKDILGTGESAIRGTIRQTMEVINNTGGVPLFSLGTSVRGGSFKISKNYVEKTATKEDVFISSLVEANVLAGLSGLPEVIVPLDIYFANIGAEKAINDLEKGNYGGIVTSSLMIIPFASNLRRSTKNIGKNANIDAQYMGSIIYKGDESVSKTIITAGKDETIAKGKSKSVVNENGDMAEVYGIISGIKKTKTGVTKSDQFVTASRNKYVGEATIVKKGIPRDELGTTPAFVGGGISKELGKITEIDMPGFNNWIRKEMKYIEYFISNQLPKIKEYRIVQGIARKTNKLFIIGSTKFKDLTFETAPDIPVRILKERRFYDELTGQIIKDVDKEAYLKLEKMTGKESRVKGANIYKIDVETVLIKKSRIKLKDVNIRYVLKKLKEDVKMDKIIDFGNSDIMKEINDITFNEPMKLKEKTPLSKTFKEEPFKNENLEKELMNKLYPQDSKLNNAINKIVKQNTKQEIVQSFQLPPSIFEGTGKYERYSYSENLIPKLLSIKVKEKSLSDNQFGDFSGGDNKYAGASPSGKIESLTGSGKFGNLGSMGKIPSRTLRNTNDVNEKLINEVMNKINSKINSKQDSNLKSSLKEKFSSKTKQESLSNLNFNENQVNININKITQKLNQMTGLKYKQVILNEQKFDQSFGEIPFNANIKDTGFFGAGFEDFDMLKQKIRKKKKRKLKTMEQFAVLPDFTSKALGIQPDKISMKDVNKALKKIYTGFEIRKGVTFR